jgi:hypothetical protein
MSGQPEAHCLLPLLYLPGAELAPARASGGIYGSKPGVQAVLRLRAELLSGLWKKPGRQFDSIERSPKSWRTPSRCKGLNLTQAAEYSTKYFPLVG